MSNKKVFIKHHLGLGDAIVHNGMVRKIFEEKNCDIFLASKFTNIDNVRFMYRDNPRINVVGVNNDDEMNQLINNNQYDEIISSHFDTGRLRYDLDFDDSFYKIVDMDPNVKKEYFHIERNQNKENEVFDTLVTKKDIDRYIFLHEKPTENILIDRNKIRNDLPIIYADKQFKTFDLLKIIENAEECHIISSSFLSLFMCKKYNKNVFAHMYADRIELKDYIIKNNIQVII
jgi:hypothetical protein